jgi:LysM repeat protein
MSKFRKVAMVLLALVIMLSAMGFTAQPAQAAGCRTYHWVRYGETLASIGRYYGVSWTHIASVNGIGRPYTIYPGQRFAIRTGGSYARLRLTPADIPVAHQRSARSAPELCGCGVDPNTTVSIRTKISPVM